MSSKGSTVESDTRNSENRKSSESAPLHDSGDNRAAGSDGGDVRGDGDDCYVLALDVGTTTMRGHVYDSQGRIRGTSSVKLQIEQLKPGWFEIDPHKLFEDAKTVLRDSMKGAGVTARQVRCLGIATQRNTFLTWDRETGEPFHHLITWQDLRAWEDVLQWNNSLTLRLLNSGAKFAHFFTRQNRHKAASVLTFSAKQVTLRLHWVLNNVPNVRKRACEKQALFGCIETWLLWKLTKGKLHATDYSCASTTGIFDPYSVEWSPIVTGLVNIPASILPEIRDTSGDFGETDPDIFGEPIPIRAIVADQQGAMFGQCCFNKGDIKCTVGTGTFVDINTGDKPHASMSGLYPLVGWKIGDEMTFLAEGHSADTGNVLEWAREIGLFKDVSDTSEMASSVKDSGGVCFVPAFSGIQQPINDDSATTSIMGVTLTTTKAHIVRAMLESLAFRFKALYETIINETQIPLSSIRVDGGVCNNDFLMQLMSDIIHQPMDRSAHPDMTSMGAAFLAGLASGVWQSKDQLRAMWKSNKLFEPQPNWSTVRNSFHLWEKAQIRSLHWYQESSHH